MVTAVQAQAALLESLIARIKEAGWEEDYCSLTLQPGNTVIFDWGPDSECRGTAWVRLITATPSLEVGKNGCAQWLNYLIEVGMAGPVPGLDVTLSEFTPPGDEELFEAAQRQGDEMQLMFRAIRAAALEEVALGDYQPQGPEGGVLGGTWTVTVPEV